MLLFPTYSLQQFSPEHKIKNIWNFQDSGSDAGNIGVCIVIAGMMGSLVCGIVLDKTHKFKWVNFQDFIYKITPSIEPRILLTERSTLTSVSTILFPTVFIGHWGNFLSPETIMLPEEPLSQGWKSAASQIQLSLGAGAGSAQAKAPATDAGMQLAGHVCSPGSLSVARSHTIRSADRAQLCKSCGAALKRYRLGAGKRNIHAILFMATFTAPRTDARI